MPLETCSLRAAAPLCGKRKCISTHLNSEFLLKQAAAGQFTSGMIKAQTLGREPPSSLFSATMDTHPSFETGNRKSNVWRFNNGAGSLKSCSCSKTTFPAERSPTCLINRSPLEAWAASALTQWMSCTAGCFQQLHFNSWCNNKTGGQMHKLCELMTNTESKQKYIHLFARLIKSYVCLILLYKF